jgi:N-acyl-D-aspartate/D-glutamate deacylase
VPSCDTLIRNVIVLDGRGGEGEAASVAIAGDRIQAIGELDGYSARNRIDGRGNVLAPGFIDAHTHDDICLIRSPEMLPKLSQGVTTVVVGNCGISAAPVRLAGELPDPMNLLGEADQFSYPTFAAYVAAIHAARPAVNVAAFVGHTALRNNHMDRLDRTATANEVEDMRAQLRESLDHGSLGLSTGLAYLSAHSASTEEVMALAEPLSQAGALYSTHLRSEGGTVLEAMDEAFQIARHAKVPVIISHLKCAGIDNWGRAGALLRAFESAGKDQTVACDCYPYAASSSTLDLRQVDARITIMITWSGPHPEVAGRTLGDISALWCVGQMEAAQRLQPAGAIYHGISEEDMRTILRHPGTMVGSDGLPNDPLPHPRLWGTFPRVLGYYSREQNLFSLSEAVRKMTSLPAQRFSLRDRGLIREGYRADLALFNPRTVRDVATFSDPARPAEGIEAVWVNGVLSFRNQVSTGQRAGRFLPRQS